MAATIAAIASAAASAAGAVGGAASAAAGALGSGLGAAGSALSSILPAGLGGGTGAAATGAFGAGGTGGLGAGIPTLGGTSVMPAAAPTLAGGMPSMASMMSGGGAAPLMNAAAPASALPGVGEGMLSQLGHAASTGLDWAMNPGSHVAKMVAKNPSVPDEGAQLLGKVVDQAAAGSLSAGMNTRNANISTPHVGNLQPQQPQGSGYQVRPDGVIQWMG